MRVREIKEKKLRVGDKVIWKNDYENGKHDRVRIITGIDRDFRTVNYNCSDYSHLISDLIAHYFIVEEGSQSTQIGGTHYSKKQPISLLGVMNTWEDLTFPSDDINNQVGGDHYNKNDPIQFARDNYPKEQLEGFFRINVDKYVARYDKKNGLEDLKKAKHYLDMLIELKESEHAK